MVAHKSLPLMLRNSFVWRIPAGYGLNQNAAENTSVNVPARSMFHPGLGLGTVIASIRRVLRFTSKNPCLLDIPFSEVGPLNRFGGSMGHTPIMCVESKQSKSSLLCSSMLRPICCNVSPVELLLSVAQCPDGFFVALTDCGF